MLSLGSIDYNMTDFSQAEEKCPKCSERKVFIQRYVTLFQFNSQPVYPRRKWAKAVCRACGNIVAEGADHHIDQKLETAVADIKIPKWFYMGAILYPLAILGIVLLATQA